MCATLMGAASTANSELRVGTPVSVLVESEDSRMVVVGAGRRALIVAVLPNRGDAALARKEILKLADTVKMI